MVSTSSNRKSLIDSSIKIARRYRFRRSQAQVLICSIWEFSLKSGKPAIDLEATNSSRSALILTAMVYHTPKIYSTSYPIESIQQHLDRVHLFVDYIYNDPRWGNRTRTEASLYDPYNFDNADFGIAEWIDGGLSANKIVFFLPFYGFAWRLENPMDNAYKEIKNYIEQYGPDVHVRYNSTYVVNYWTKGTTWYCFDDVEAIRTKVSYAKEKKLLGYVVWQISYDYNWILSSTAAEVGITDSSGQDNRKGQNDKRQLLVILLSTIAAFALLLGIFVIFYRCRRNLRFKGKFLKNL
ncbi:hypothetical protein Pint_14526 [Pistacia integerrima]|uniref:Uncharacterized protein n=1 Tax=Pistacia integerrima TaxID=434235 RepID=A0ACC0YB92_9ROSI|nr:hypothetical protein Pint_14526 [Pistacia integerrima]